MAAKAARAAGGAVQVARGRRAAAEIDQLVAARLRERRLALGLTGEQLGDLIGTAYQQIHRYEAGLNRLTAGRLHALAQALDTRVGYFFEGLERTPPAAPIGRERQLLELARHFTGLSRRHQEALCELARALAGGGGEPEPEESGEAAAA
jgi:transcriptional regulator with XRE-family HTH domain